MPIDETELVKLLKTAYESKLPDWKVAYMARICKNLQVHTKGLLFSKVDTLFPHEHPDSKAHCINTYEPITKGSIWKAINNIIRIFSSSSFTVSASDNALEFVNQDNFEGKNLFSFFLDKWTSTTIAEDPNSLCAIYPQAYLDDYPGDMVRFIKNLNRTSSTGITQSTSLIQHVSKDMVCFISEAESDKEYSLVDSIVKSEVFYDERIQTLNAKQIVEKTYNQQVQIKITKAVYHLFTREYFVRFVAVDDKEFTYDFYEFKKSLDIIPCFPLTAVSEIQNINVSFVDPFLPFGNLALLQHRNHRAVDLMFSYPRMSEIQVPCEAENCTDGRIYTGTEINGVRQDTTCGRCRGTGFITVQSPYKTYQKRLDIGLNDPENIKQMLIADPVSFHTPDVGILNYSKDSWKGYLAMAEEAVFIQQKQFTGNVESGKAKEIDKEGEYSWIQNISKALNADLSRVIQCIENYISASPAQVSLEQPISFAVVTETEAFEALNVILSSPASIIIKTNQVENFINKFVSRSSPIVRAIKVLKLVDPLLFYSTLDIQVFKSNNAVTVEAWTTHIYAYSILMQLYEMDKLLFDKEETVIAKMVLDKIPQPQATSLKDNLLKVA